MKLVAFDICIHTLYVASFHYTMVPFGLTFFSRVVLGDKKRRDSIQSIKYIPHLDAYITASQKGALSVWSTKVE